MGAQALSAPKKTGTMPDSVSLASAKGFHGTLLRLKTAEGTMEDP